MATTTKPTSLPDIDSSSSLVYSISDDLDGLPLVRRVRGPSSGPLRSFLLAVATLLVVLLSIIVVYLVVSLSLVQQQLTRVSLELDNASTRLKRVEMELLLSPKGSVVMSSGNENQEFPQQLEHRSHVTQPIINPLPEEEEEEEEEEKIYRSESTTATNILTMLQRLPSEPYVREKHRVGKREASKPASRVPGNNRRLHQGELRRRRSSTSKVTKSKKNIQERWLILVDKEFKNVRLEMETLRNDMESLRNDVAHPSALMSLPGIQETSYQNATSNYDNAIEWTMEYNSLFDPEDSTYMVIKAEGTYFIYLQVTYNGQTKSVNPTCSHMVMLQNPNYSTRHRALLSGSRTQHKLGGVIRFTPNNGELRAIDTVHLSGVFHLTAGDRIYVKPDDLSHDCIVSPFKDKTFFGVFRLQSSYQQYK